MFVSPKSTRKSMSNFPVSPSVSPEKLENRSTRRRFTFSGFSEESRCGPVFELFRGNGWRDEKEAHGLSCRYQRDEQLLLLERSVSPNPSSENLRFPLPVWIFRFPGKR